MWGKEGAIFFFSFFFISIFVLLYTGCARKTDVATGADTESLRLMVEQRLSTITWAADVEGDLLDKKIGPAAGIAQNLKPQPAILAAVNESFVKPVYPAVAGFGSLDTSAIGNEQRTVLDGFCTALLSSTAADGFMVPTADYSLILFLSDIHGVFPEWLGTESFFTKTLYGTPFTRDDLFQVPVRFIADSGYLDVMLFLNQKAGWKIDQIQIKNFKVTQNGT